MSSISITHTIYRDDDETVIELEVTGKYYRGEFEGFEISAPHQLIKLTEAESADIIAELDEAQANDFDEDGAMDRYYERKYG